MDIKNIKHKYIQLDLAKIVFRKGEKDLVNLPIKDERVHPNPKQHKILQTLRETRVPKIHNKQLRSYIITCNNLKAS